MKDFLCTVFGLASGWIAKWLTNDVVIAVSTAFLGGMAAYAGTTIAKHIHLKITGKKKHNY